LRASLRLNPTQKDGFADEAEAFSEQIMAIVKRADMGLPVAKLIRALETGRSSH